MSWLKKLLSGFREKKESVLPKEKVLITDAEKWLNSKKDSILKQANMQLMEHLDELSDLKAKLAEDTEKLQNAKLLNENLHPRERQLMEGNREMFITRLNALSKLIVIPKKPDHALSESMVSVIEKEISNFEKQTPRTVIILQQFFGNEVNAVGSDIAKIRKLSLKIRETLSHENVKGFNSAIAEAKSILSALNSEKEFEKEKSELNLRKKERLEFAEKLNKRMIEISSGEDYKTYVALEQEYDQLKKDRAAKKQEFLEAFYPIDKALRKMPKDMHDKSVEKYLEEPSEALINDETLGISLVVDSIKKRIVAGELDIKDRLREKVLLACSHLTKETLQKLRDDYLELVLKIDQTGRRIQNNSARSEIQKLTKDKEFAEESAADIDLEIHKKDELIAKLQIESKRDTLESWMRELTHLEVSLEAK